MVKYERGHFSLSGPANISLEGLRKVVRQCLSRRQLCGKEISQVLSIYLVQFGKLNSDIF